MIEIKHRVTCAVLHTVDAAHLREADLREAHLYGADLYGADLYGADLRGADLRGAHLREAHLYGADLREADLRGAHLRGADLYGADLRGATRYENETIAAFTRIERIGSRADTLTLFKCTSGIFVETGCFVGTLAKFKAAVLATHNDNNHAKAYGAAIDLAHILFS